MTGVYLQNLFKITPWHRARCPSNLCRPYSTSCMALRHHQIRRVADHRDTLLRCLHTATSFVPPPSTNKAASRAKFEHVYTKIADELVDELKKQNIPEDAQRWYRKSLDYNVPGGKLNRGMSVVETVEILKRRSLTDDEYTKAAVLGWCLELLQSYFIVSDDIMDTSTIRRGKLCWYRNSEVGMIAINDSLMISSTIYRLIESYFKKEPYYVDLVELFLEITWLSEIGQLNDLITSPEQVDLSKFSLKKQSSIAISRYAPSFYIPVACAMYICGISHTPIPYLSSTEPAKDPYEIAKSISIPFAEYYQAQDDFLDFSGPPEHTGKAGTDIINNKCSWCIATALSHASPDQRKILEQNYGKKPRGGPSELAVRKVFDEIGVRGLYVEYEERAVASLKERIAKLPEVEGSDTLRRVFEALLATIYKRNK